MRIVICDDHRLLAEVLAAAIVQAGHTVQAITGTPAEARVAVERHRPDLLLLDLTFPGGNSLQVAREIVTHHPQIRTVVLTGSDSVGPLREALEIGVAGYLRKDERIDQMLTTLERCVRGEQVFDEVLMRRLEHSARERDRRRTLVSEFTPRERAVAHLLLEGLNTAEMVATLGISESTVRTHVQAILSKLSVHSRVEAAALLHGRLTFTDEAVS